jgi:uncharacterized protein
MIARCKWVVTAVLLLAVASPLAPRAGPYEDGDSAFHRKNYEVALQHWRPLAVAGHADAQLGVATLYYGGLGVVMDYDLAFEWCAKAADQGVPRAQHMLAAMYRDGKGVQQDQATAVVLFRKAADHDVPWAHYSLGLMYRNGTGVGADLGEAYYWLSLAAEAPGKDNAQLRSTASYLRDQAAAKLNREQVAEVQQRVTKWKSAVGSR